MPVYYNEFDPQKAAWIRALMKRGVIAQGEVDERPIQSVRPDDLRGFTQFHFFAGIAVWSYALRCAGWPDDEEVLTASCPCQPFSAAGKKAAQDDDRHLWPVLFKLIEARRPKRIFGEQVSSIDGLAWFDLVRSDLDGAGYTVGAQDTCSAGVGAPCIRQRLYFVAESEQWATERHRQQVGATSGGMQAEAWEQRVRTDVGDGCDVDNMAESAEAGHSRWSSEEGGRGSLAGPERLRDAERMGGAEEDGRGRRQDDGDGWRRECASSGAGENGGMEFSNKDGRGEARQDQRIGFADGDKFNCSTERLGITRGALLEVRPSIAGDVGEECATAERIELTQPDWTEPNWVLTRPKRLGERPGLRPVERLPFEIPDGLAADLGYLRTASGFTAFPIMQGTKRRAMRLRGYGDAINARVAEMFIRAYMEVTK